MKTIQYAAIAVTALILYSNPLPASQATTVIGMQQALDIIARQYGVHIVVDTIISADKVAMPALDDKHAAINAVLAEYNWVGIQEANSLKRIVITSKTGDYRPVLAYSAHYANNGQDKQNNWRNDELDNFIDNDKLSNWQNVEFVEEL